MTKRNVSINVNPFRQQTGMTEATLKNGEKAGRNFATNILKGQDMRKE